MVFLCREVLIEKHYRSVTPRSVCDTFWNEVCAQSSRQDVPPVIISGKYYILSVLRGDLWLVAMLTAETSSLLVCHASLCTARRSVFNVCLRFFVSPHVGAGVPASCGGHLRRVLRRPGRERREGQFRHHISAAGGKTACLLYILSYIHMSSC